MQRIDQFGHSIKEGRLYAVGSRRSAGDPCELFYDHEIDELMARNLKSKQSQRLDEIDPSVHWTLIDEDNCELIVSPDELSSADCVDSAIRRARVLRDQLDAIEQDLIAQLDASGDSLLVDEIRTLVHGDGFRDRLLLLLDKRVAVAG